MKIPPIIPYLILLFTMFFLIVLVIGINKIEPPQEAIEEPVTEERDYYELLSYITFYTPTERQTDSTPDINANGLKPKVGDVACPRFIELGTIVEINGSEYTCNDRMNIRYEQSPIPYFDILLLDEQIALELGKQIKTVKVKI